MHHDNHSTSHAHAHTHGHTGTPMNRRSWLTRSGLGLASALGAGTLGNLALGAGNAQAQTADYKALVCIFMFGGNDAMNMVVPTDNARYAAYKDVRQKLAIPAASLTPLSGINFGLHPAMAALAPAWAQGNLAPVFNVGPLFKPMTKAEYRAEPNTSRMLPDNLFSHNDQQNHWQTGTARLETRSGWGARAAAEFGATNPVISVAGSPRFGGSDTQAPMVLPSTPGAVFGLDGLQASDLGWTPNVLRRNALTTMYGHAQDLSLTDAYAKAQRDAFTLSARLSGLIKVTPGSAGAMAAIDTAFAPLINADKTVRSGLGRQLYQVAKLIAGNATIGGNRQIFFGEMGGFDTHSAQVITDNAAGGYHATLLKELGDALACFNAAMNALGMGNAVTTFTQSDFGRTFAPNRTNGTDHAWGSHHLVMGGAVKGGTSYGAYPELALGGTNDVGVEDWERQGRWLPTSSVDQHASTLLSWFGATDTQLNRVLPNLQNFSTRRLGFL
jgi:uncharacterized protein (DUF1501 family)